MDKKLFDDYKAQMKEYRKKMEEEGKSFFIEVLKPMFEKYPELKSLSWSQYTPYFNDGDACVFRSNASYPSIQFSIDEELEDYDEESWYSDDDKSPEAECYRSAVSILDSFDDEDYEMLFGDHVKVIVTREGIETEEYEHD